MKITHTGWYVEIVQEIHLGGCPKARKAINQRIERAIRKAILKAARLQIRELSGWASWIRVSELTRNLWRTNLTRHSPSSLAALWCEHKTVRREYAFLTSKGDRNLARRLYRASESDAHFTECNRTRTTTQASLTGGTRCAWSSMALESGEIIDEVDRLMKRGIRRN